MDDPNSNSFWDLLWGDNSMTGSARLIIYATAFAIVGGSVFYLIR